MREGAGIGTVVGKGVGAAEGAGVGEDMELGHVEAPALDPGHTNPDPVPEQ